MTDHYDAVVIGSGAGGGTLGRPDVKDRAVGSRLTTEDLPRPGNRVTVDRDGHPHLAFAATNGGEAAILRQRHPRG